MFLSYFAVITTNADDSVLATVSPDEEGSFEEYLRNFKNSFFLNIELRESLYFLLLLKNEEGKAGIVKSSLLEINPRRLYASLSLLSYLSYVHLQEPA